MEEAWNFFEDILPPEVTVLVLSYFSLEEVVYVSLVCKTWNAYFDTKAIWKQIYELNFGVVEEKSIDLTQNLRWKRLYFKAHSALRWKTDFLQSKDAFSGIFIPYTNGVTNYDNISANGRYHVVVVDSMFAVTDIKTAAKIVPMNHHPVTLYAGIFNMTGLKQFRSNVRQHQDTKPPKDNVFTMKHTAFYISYNPLVKTGTDQFAYRGTPTTSVLYSVESHVLQPKNLTALQVTQPTGNYNPIAFNSKFVAYTINRIGCYEGHILDISKKCLHCCHIHCKDDQFVPETTVCTDSNSCAIIDQSNGPFKQVFASQCNPNKVLFFGVDDTMFTVWTHGEGFKSVKSKNARNVSQLSEHVVEVDGAVRHWFTYTTDKKYFIDLNNTSDKIEVPVVPLTDLVSEWVPKKSKIALVLRNKVTVYDLERKTRCVKFTVSDPVTALAFTTSGTGLFLATAKHIHLYIWETALLIASLPHTIAARIVKIQWALGQVLVVSTRQQSVYKKIRTKIDF